MKKLHLICSGFRLEAAKELFAGLQYSALETLQLTDFDLNVLLAFKTPMEFPRLKTLSINVFGRARDERSSQNPFNVGLSFFFSNTKLPCLESLTIRNSYLRSYNCPWDMPPSFANNIVEPTVLPNLKRLVMNNLHISQACSAFLASLYSRGDCEIDLTACKVESSLDSPAFTEILTLFSLERHAFDDKLRSLKLYEKAVWYNLLNMDRLKSIAASMYLSLLAVRVNDLLEPVAACVALAEAAGAEQETSLEGAVLQKNYRTTLEAISELHRVSVAVNNGGFSAGGGGGDSQ